MCVRVRARVCVCVCVCVCVSFINVYTNVSEFYINSCFINVYVLCHFYVNICFRETYICFIQMHIYIT